MRLQARAFSTCACALVRALTPSAFMDHAPAHARFKHIHAPLTQQKSHHARACFKRSADVEALCVSRLPSSLFSLPARRKHACATPACCVARGRPISLRATHCGCFSRANAAPARSRAASAVFTCALRLCARCASAPG
eukprot:4714680-Pleurochrysis_carterae.AAC.4